MQPRICVVLAVLSVLKSRINTSARPRLISTLESTKETTAAKRDVSSTNTTPTDISVFTEENQRRAPGTLTFSASAGIKDGKPTSELKVAFEAKIQLWFACEGALAGLGENCIMGQSCVKGFADKNYCIARDNFLYYSRGMGNNTIMIPNPLDCGTASMAHQPVCYLAADNYGNRCGGPQARALLPHMPFCTWDLLFPR